MTTLAYDGTLRHRAVPLGDTIEFHKNFASSLIRVRVGHRRGGGRGVGPALAGRSTAVVATRERGRAGRAQLSTPPQLEPDRAGSRCHCSPVPLLACPRNAPDARWRHFLPSRPLANVDVAGSIPVSCSKVPERPRCLRAGARIAWACVRKVSIGVECPSPLHALARGERQAGVGVTRAVQL